MIWLSGFDTTCISIENREIYTMAKCEGICMSYMGENHGQAKNIPGANHSQHFACERPWEGMGSYCNPEFPDWFFTYRGRIPSATFSIVQWVSKIILYNALHLCFHCGPGLSLSCHFNFVFFFISVSRIILKFLNWALFFHVWLLMPPRGLCSKWTVNGYYLSKKWIVDFLKEWNIVTAKYEISL